MKRSAATVQFSGRSSYPMTRVATGFEATYKDGVLEVTVEKKPECKSAKIVIN